MSELEKRFRGWLAQPRGLLELVAFTFAVAIGLAIWISASRAFFERYVREKYPPSSVSTLELARKIDQGREARVGALECEALYDLWMQSSEPYPRLPAAIVTSCGARVGVRLERTFAAGSRTQRLRAAELLRATPRPAFAAARDLGLLRARALRDTELEASLLSVKVESP